MSHDAGSQQFHDTDSQRFHDTGSQRFYDAGSQQFHDAGSQQSQAAGWQQFQAAGGHPTAAHSSPGGVGPEFDSQASQSQSQTGAPHSHGAQSHGEVPRAQSETAGARTETKEPQHPATYRPGEVAGPQSEAGVTQEPSPANTPAVLDVVQREVLRAALNRVVPSRESLSGAGDLGIGDGIERSMAASIPLRRLFLEGLGEIAITAHLQAAEDFRSLDPARQTVVLETVEQRLPAFFAALVEHAYRGYYTRVDVQRAVGHDARPPQPLGHELPPFDPTLLDRQRRRTPFWRPAP
jgi:hypothetical protein